MLALQPIECPLSACDVASVACRIDLVLPFRLLQVHRANERQRRQTGLQVTIPHAQYRQIFGSVFQIHWKTSMIMLENVGSYLFLYDRDQDFLFNVICKLGEVIFSRLGRCRVSCLIGSQLLGETFTDFCNKDTVV